MDVARAAAKLGVNLTCHRNQLPAWKMLCPARKARPVEVILHFGCSSISRKIPRKAFLDQRAEGEPKYLKLF